MISSRAISRFAFLCVAAALSACGNDGGGWSMPPPDVSVLETTAVDVPMTFTYAARVSNSRDVEVRARVSGILQKRAYIEGAVVNKGDVLFVIDPAPLRAEADAANAHLAQAKAAAAQAESDAVRAEDVFAKGLISTRERDMAVSQRDQARAALAAAKADAERRAIDLGYTKVTAPVSGITSVGARPEGSFVSAQQEESLLTTITPIDPVTIDFSVSEGDMLKLRALTSSGRLLGPKRGAGTAALVMNSGEPYAHAGKVEYLDVVLDRATGSLLGRAQFPNPEQTLLPGMFVRLVLKGYVLKGAVIVPERAVQQGPQGAFVYVVDKETKAEVRPVTLGLPVPGGRSIDAGLAPGERVIIDNLMKVQPGSAVVISQAAGAGAAPAGNAGKPVAGSEKTGGQ
jgi:membrane fusion protein (multidrug efflux system)